MFQDNQLLAIRWVWYQDPEEYQGLRYIPADQWLEEERDSEMESSCEVEYFGGEWWCGKTAFGLVLNPTQPIRRVWATDVHTYCEHGKLVAGDCPHSSSIAIGWEGAYKKMPKWRKYPKTWWAEGTFPARPDVVAFAMMADADESCHFMWETAKKVFGNLPVIHVTGHPDAYPDETGKWVTFYTIYDRSTDAQLWEHAWHETNSKIVTVKGYMDDYGNLVEVHSEVNYC